MGVKGVNWRIVAIRSSYYLLTAIILGCFGWALYYAYLYFNVALAWWICLYIVIVAYLGFSIISTAKIRRGTRKVAFHSFALQLVPILASIFIYQLISKGDDYTPLTGRVGTYERAFKDMQHTQKKAALKNGLSPFESRKDIEAQFKKLRREGKLTRIATNSKYVVQDLKYSAPYVVPKVKRLLDDIAESFQEKTQSKAKFVVTSVLRTKEDVKKLKKTNINASSASCHCNATTIDISYVRFGADIVKPRSDYELRMALAQTLHELRKAERCYVKIERKQYCYHITVR